MSGDRLTPLQWRILRVLSGLKPPWTERASALEDPVRFEIAGSRILIDSPHEILVNKLCALLSRSELRDLLDVKALVENGIDLDRALADAPRKDAGFSPLTLAWVLKGFQLRVLGGELGLGNAELEEIAKFQASLVERLVRSGAPE